jgi:Tol biopolymer transport system component
MSGDGNDASLLTPDGYGWHIPVWSPDGQRIAFTSLRDGPLNIYAMNADGTGQTRVTSTGSTTEDSRPQWSPDGSHIMFVRKQGPSRFSQDIFVVNTDGSGIRNVTNHSALYLSEAWSPDGSRIAFTRQEGIPGTSGGATYPSDLDVHVIDLNGRNETDVSNAPSGYRFLSWSPDGSLVAASVNADIYVMRADDEATPIRLNSEPGTGGASPTWSPDSTKIVFATGDIAVMNADGTNPVNLTNTADSGEYEPEWSPDGTRIVSWGKFSSPAGIFVTNADGTKSTKVTDGAYPAWRPQFRMGDANCDSQRDSIDATLILQYVGGLSPTTSCLVHAHAQQDGEINALDAAVILQFSAGLVASIPP